MFKEVEDLRGACENIIKRSDSIRDLTKEAVNLIDKIKSKTGQEDAVEMALAIRKELANLFILNSNIEDSLKALQKVINSIKKLDKIP